METLVGETRTNVIVIGKHTREMLSVRPLFWVIAGFAVLMAGVAGLNGCVSTDSDAVTVSVDVDALVPDTPDVSTPTPVEVTDIREDAEFERSSLGVYMGGIVVKPSETEAIQQIVQAKANQLLGSMAGQVPILVGIRTFEIVTPSTALYWDINVNVEIVLRVNNQDQTAAASATKRTYIWPSERLINEVTHEALSLLVIEVEAALSKLLEQEGPS